MVKCLLAMWETWVRSLGREDPVEKEVATYSSTLAWKIPWTEEPDKLQSMGSQRVGHDWATSLSLFTFWFQFSSVQLLSRVWLFEIPWTAAHQASLSITNSQSLLKVHWVGDVIQPSHPLLSEVIDISPCNLDSSMCFIQPSILHHELCIKVT